MEFRDKTARQVLEEYFENSPFDSPLEDGPTVKFYSVPFGPFTIDIPNTNKRNEFVVHHDLHHIITGYKTTRLGEGEIGAWELGTGLWRWPMAMFLNFGGMVTGIYLSPRKTWQAYKQGVASRCLYQLPQDELLQQPFSELQEYVLGGGRVMNIYHRGRYALFFTACVLALLLSPVVVLADRIRKGLNIFCAE